MKNLFYFILLPIFEPWVEYCSHNFFGTSSFRKGQLIASVVASSGLGVVTT